MKRLEITGLRGIAACIIAYVFHYTILFQAMPQISSSQAVFMGELARYGAYMSEIFFVLSGMLMWSRYAERLSDIRMWAFLKPKIIKIYPLMICTAVLTWVLQYAGYLRFGSFILHADGAETRNSLPALVLSLLGLQTGWFSDNDTYAVNGPSWFISVWIVCQLIFFVITKYSRKLWQKNLWYGIFCVLGLILMIRSMDLPLLYTCSGRGYFSFFTGVFLMQIFQKLDNIRSRIGCVLSMVILAAALWCGHQYEIPCFLAYVSLFVWPPLIFICCQCGWLKRILSLKAFVWLGIICMPVFLCNMFTDVLIRFLDLSFRWNLDYNNWLVWMVHVAFSLLIAWVFHLIFERKGVFGRKEH